MAGNPRIYVAISTFLPLVGGAEMQALALAHDLRMRGFETTIITLRHERTWPKREVIEGVPVMRVAGRLLAGRERLPSPLKKLFYFLGLFVLAWSLFRHRRRFDILHEFQLNLLALPIALFCRLTGKAMVVSVRSTSTIQLGSVAGAEVASRRRMEPGGHPPLPESDGSPGAPSSPPRVDSQRESGGDLAPLEALGKPVVRFTRALLQRNRAVLIVLSSRMKSYLVAHDFGLPDMRFIPNGVDTLHFTPADGVPSEARAQSVVCVSKMRYEKGIDVLLNAWRLVQERLPQPSQTRLIIVGDGPLLDQLECMASELGVASSVEFTGLQSDVPSQLHRGSIAVLPSRWEGMPNALLEAMACGLPCVATRVSGSEDIVQHGVNGLLVEPEDDQGLAQALLALLHDTALAQQYGRAARETVEHHYSFEHMMDAYVALYHDVFGYADAVAEDVPASQASRLPS